VGFLRQKFEFLTQKLFCTRVSAAEICVSAAETIYGSFFHIFVISILVSASEMGVSDAETIFPFNK
jgi:hypothetical protein